MKLSGKRVALLVADLYQELEFWYPYYRLQGEGAEVVSAGILQGRRVTSVSSIKDDLRNAGAEWIDQEVVRDGNLITSRVPIDLPTFCRTIIEALSDEPQH